MKRLSWLMLILTLVACGPAVVVTPTVSPVPSFASAPSPAPSSASKSEMFFGDDTCSWPCWQGITPGVTTSSDALQLLQVSPVVSKSTVQSEERRPGIGTARWHWGIGSILFDCSMEWKDGIVSGISLTAFSKFSIEEMISRFGPPEKVSVIDCEMTPEQPREWCADFYYVKRGFEIRLKWKPEYADDVQLSPSDPIQSVFLSEPSTIEDWLSYLGSGRAPIDLRDWKGYGNLLELYLR
jgi:hypothetical protein